MFRIFPKETSFFDFFEQHLNITVLAINELSFLFEHESSTNESARKIKVLEHQADKVAHACIDALRKTFITPFERDDIYRLITHLDDIVDYIEEISARMAMYHLVDSKPEISPLIRLFKEAVVELQKAILQLRELKRVDLIQLAIANVHRYENEADQLMIEAISRLFDEETDLKKVIKWKEVYEGIENGIDSCQAVANIMEGMILEYG